MYVFIWIPPEAHSEKDMSARSLFGRWLQEMRQGGKESNTSCISKAVTIVEKGSLLWLEVPHSGIWIETASEISYLRSKEFIS